MPIPMHELAREASPEVLTEALIALERARRHECEMRRETEGVLEGLRALSAAQGSAEVFGTLIEVLRRFVPFEHAFVLREVSDGVCASVASTSPLFEAPSWPLGPMLARVFDGRTAALFDVRQAEEWRVQPPSVLAQVGSALHTPLHAASGRAVLVLVHRRTAFFTQEHLHLLERFAPLSNQALANIEHRERLEHQARELRRANRTLQALTRCSETLVHARDEAELLETVCRHIVEIGGYRLAWVGYACDDEARTVRPVAHVGSDRDYVEGLALSWGDDESRRGAGGAAIRSGRPMVARDIATDAVFASWREAACGRGLASCLALPLKGRGGAFATLSIYSAEVDAFDDAEIALLERLADNLAYGIASLREAEARTRAERELDYRAHYDELTGLPNRRLLCDRLAQASMHAARTGTRVGVVLLGVDRFKIVNDSRGPKVGDALLVETGRRLRACVRGEDTVARASADEFIVVLPEIADDDGIALVARKLLAALEEPIVAEGETLVVSASAGLCIHPQDGDDPETLLRNAGAALHTAKSLGGNALRFYSPDMNARAAARFALEAELRLALQRGELRLHFQPKVCLGSGKLCGVEALVRWEHPERGLRPPAEFIPIAEETGLIRPLGEWVLREACAAVRRWQDVGLPVVPVAVNLSARQFGQQDLVQRIATVLRETGLAAQLLELEITESTLMHDVDAAVATLGGLKALGMQLSLDDFGTGYSSLNYLKRLPIDRLKIDRSFVRDITTDPEDAAICVAIIGLAHNLRMSVVAEGVETEGQVEYLRRHGCDVVQGYYFHPPLETEAFAQLLWEGGKFPVPGPREERRTLLVVDDEPNIRAALKRLFRPDGYEVLAAASAREGFELLATHEVQVILSDQRMPEMSGTEFLERMCELYPDTIRIVLSGYTDLDTITDSINRGAIYKFLTKPWDGELLRRHVREAFRHHHALHPGQHGNAP
jgi:diguanylate cyclase (GGDEF)-like protein